MKANQIAISCLLASISSVLITACSSEAPKASNSLDVGFDSKAPESITINPNGLMNFNGKSTEELYALRAKLVSAYPALLQGDYKPSPNVISIDGKNPWWGIKGYLFRGQITDVTEGVSRESASFSNPFLLVRPEWYGTSMHWSNQRFPTPDDFAKVFPTYLQASKAVIYPKEKREEIKYDVLPYFNMVASMLSSPWSVSDLAFNLRAYNARDFGYEYFYIDPNTSNNINKLPPEVLPIEEELTTRTRDTCAPKCNDVVAPDSLCNFQLKGLPAKVRILLWKKKPGSHVAPADMKVDLIFQ